MFYAAHSDRAALAVGYPSLVFLLLLCPLSFIALRLASASSQLFDDLLVADDPVRLGLASWDVPVRQHLV